jgi:photosystem II stability/assembly factor-like uncharacterized protein
MAILILSVALIASDDPPGWSFQTSHTDARFRGISAVSADIAWASGTRGTYARTKNGGKSWKPGQVPSAEALDFRDVHAFDAETAYLLSAGPGDASRIYKTIDGGKSWTLQLTNPDPKGFLDALGFFDRDHGLAFGDPVAGRFALFTTDNGGRSWMRVDPSGMPPALPNEGAFAASGTCLVSTGDRNAWFATGGAAVSRVFRSTDRGQSWTVAETPVLAGNPSSGIFSLAFSGLEHGLAIGGDYKAPERPGANLARTSDGGRTWSLVKAAPRDYRSGLAFVLGRSGTVVTVGPTGSELSTDGGTSWSSIGTQGFHAVSAAGPEAVWAVGDEGRIARLEGLIGR